MITCCAILWAGQALIASKSASVRRYDGTERTSRASLKWVNEKNVERHYIASDKSQQNAFIASFIGSLRDELRNEEWFDIWMMLAVSRHSGGMITIRSDHTHHREIKHPMKRVERSRKLKAPRMTR